MDNELMVPYVVVQSEAARYERTLKRVIISFMIVIMALVGIIGFLLYEDTLYDYSDVTVDSQDGGNANYIGASGVISNVEGDSPQEDSQESKKGQGH